MTVAILSDSLHHLVHQTLESLDSQEGKNFEVVLLDSRESEKWPHRNFRFPLQIEALPQENSAAMNRALELSRGSYIQFLKPGERLLSQQATIYLEELALESGRPELIYGAFLERDPMSPPRARTFPLDLVRKGVSPTELHAHWFRRDALSAVNGFSLRYNSRPSFDALCQILMRKGRTVYTRRVLVDRENRLKKTAIEAASWVHETCLILYRHFGVWEALCWIFAQNQTLLAHRIWKGIKDSFVKKSQ